MDPIKIELAELTEVTRVAALNDVELERLTKVAFQIGLVINDMLKSLNHLHETVCSLSERVDRLEAKSVKE